jgi:hypothetical protein
MGKKAKRGKGKKPAPPPAVRDPHALQIRRGHPPVPVKDNLQENRKPHQLEKTRADAPAKKDGQLPAKKG